MKVGKAIFWDKLGDEPDELIAIVQGVTGLELNQSYFGVPSLSAVELSDIALGIDNRGFAINGEAADDRSFSCQLARSTGNCCQN